MLFSCEETPTPHDITIDEIISFSSLSELENYVCSNTDYKFGDNAYVDATHAILYANYTHNFKYYYVTETNCEIVDILVENEHESAYKMQKDGIPYLVTIEQKGGEQVSYAVRYIKLGELSSMEYEVSEQEGFTCILFEYDNGIFKFIADVDEEELLDIVKDSAIGCWYRQY